VLRSGVRSSSRHLGSGWGFLVLQVFYEPDEFVEGRDAETRGEVLQDRSVRGAQILATLPNAASPCLARTLACLGRLDAVGLLAFDPLPAPPTHRNPKHQHV